MMSNECIKGEVELVLVGIGERESLAGREGLDECFEA